VVALLADRDALDANLGPLVESDFETVTVPGQVPVSGAGTQGASPPVVYGLDGFASGFSDWLTAWETWVVTPTDFIDVDENRVLVMLDVRARSRTHQVEMPVEGANLLTLRDGRIARIELFFDRSQALEAAGLSEQAMSQENVEIVRRAFAYEYYGVGDRAEAEAILDPHVVMNPIDDSPSHGPDQMRSDWERWASAFDDLRVTLEEIIDAGDQVVVVAHHEGRGQASGVKVDARFYEVYTLREGKVSRVDEYTERADALEAAGLEE
jgi:ketosteroid isomerase-like protein